MNSEILLILSIFFSLILLSFVAWPLLFSRPAKAGESLEAEKAAYLLESLRQLYADRAAGKTSSADDFERVERRLILELARNYQRLGVEPSLKPAESLGGCEGCGQPKKADFAFCPYCGQNLKAA